MQDPTTIDDTFVCQICLEERPAGDAFVLPKCGHKFDKTCLATWLTGGIVEGQVHFECQFNIGSAQPTVDHVSIDMSSSRGTCQTPITSDVVESILGRINGSDILGKYRRFQAQAADPSIRACPYCGELRAGGSAAAPSLTCASCGRGFCFLHANAHPVGSPEICAAYEAATNAGAEARASEAAISAHSRPCPGCQIRVSKAGGCNSIKCSACKTSFCWLCGKIIDDSELPTHYAFWNLSGCNNQQMSDAPVRGRAARCCNTALSIVATILCGLPSFLLGFACTLACLPCCFSSLKKGPGKHFAMMTQAVTIVLLTLTLTAIVGPFALICLCLFLPCVLRRVCGARARSDAQSSSARTPAGA